MLIWLICSGQPEQAEACQGQVDAGLPQLCSAAPCWWAGVAHFTTDGPRHVPVPQHVHRSFQTGIHVGERVPQAHAPRSCHTHDTCQKQGAGQIGSQHNHLSTGSIHPLNKNPSKFLLVLISINKDIEFRNDWNSDFIIKWLMNQKLTHTSLMKLLDILSNIV